MTQSSADLKKKKKGQKKHAASSASSTSAGARVPGGDKQGSSKKKQRKKERVGTRPTFNAPQFAARVMSGEMLICDRDNYSMRVLREDRYVVTDPANAARPMMPTCFVEVSRQSG